MHAAYADAGGGQRRRAALRVRHQEGQRVLVQEEVFRAEQRRVAVRLHAEGREAGAAYPVAAMQWRGLRARGHQPEYLGRRLRDAGPERYGDGDQESETMHRFEPFPRC